MSELLENLKAAGADTETGLARCMGKESLYTMLIGTGLKDKNFDLLKDALESGDFEKAFECAHALKGLLNNLALTPLGDRVGELTDRLRAKEPIEYREDLDEIFRLLAEFRTLAGI